ncbi:MAG: AsmA family protein, partial [Bryobacterales bacterium]|nr:AsmA family protein [Bryobacterales bacterium]
MAKALKIAGGAVAAIVLVAGGVLLLADPNQFRGTIQGQLETALNRKVSLGAMKLKIFPLSVRVEDVSIAQIAGVPDGKPFVAAKEVVVRVDLMALLKKQVQVQSLQVVEPVVELLKLPNGAWNTGSGGSQTPAQSGANPDLRLAELRVVNGAVGITDLAAKKPREEYKGIDLSLRDFAFGKPFHADLTVHLPQNIDLETALDAVYDQAAGMLQLTKLEAKLGGLALAANGSVRTASTPAQLDLKLKTTNSSITELAKAAAAFGTAFSPDMNVEGKLDADLAISGPASQAAMNGRIDLKQLVVNRKGWKQPVRIPAMQIALTPDAVRTTPFVVESGGTRINASASVLQYTTPEGTVEASLSAAGADLGELLNVAMAYGVNALDGATADGTVSIDMRLRGKLKGSAPWDYAGKGSLRNGTLALAAFKKPLQIANADIKFEEDRAVVDNLVCSLGSSNLKGSVSVRNFSAPDLRFNGDLDQLNVAELQQLTAGPAAGAPAGDAKPARKQPSKLTGQGKVSIGKLVYDSLTLNQVKSDVT